MAAPDQLQTKRLETIPNDSGCLDAVSLFVKAATLAKGGMCPTAREKIKYDI